MNKPTILPSETSDAEILAGVRRHLTEAEQFVPESPRWTRAETASRVRPVLRSRMALGGRAPMILIVVIVALAVGYYGLGSREATPGAPVPSATLAGSFMSTTLAGSFMEIRYRLTPADGHQPSESELDADAAALSKRLSFIFPVMPDASGKPAPGQNTGYEVITAAPDEVVVRFQADYTSVEGSMVMDADWIRATIGLTGVISVVGLPVLPAPGNLVAGQPPLLSGGDFDGWQVSVGGSGEPDFYGMTLTTAAAQRLAAYASANPGQYLAVLVDGRVFATTPVSGPSASSALTIPVGAGLSEQNAATLGLLLANGSLPTPITEVSATLIGPSPLPRPSGPESIPTPILAPTASPGAEASQYAPSTAGATTVPASTEDATMGPFSYWVLPDDTLAGIAAKFHVTAAQIAAANPGVDLARLRIGQEIRIPPSSWSPASPSAAQSPGGAG